MADDKAPPLEIRGVTEGDFLRWKHGPVTQWFMAYLRAYRADAILAAQEDWLGGTLVMATEQELKGRLLALGEVAEMPFSAIGAFYQQIDARQTQHQTEEDDGSETAEDDAG